MKKVILAAAMAVISMSAFAGQYFYEGTLSCDYSRGSSNTAREYIKVKELVFNAKWQSLQFSGSVECSGGGGGNSRYAEVNIGYNNANTAPESFRTVASLKNKPNDGVPIWGHTGARTSDFIDAPETVDIHFNQTSQIWCCTAVKMPAGEWGTLKASIRFQMYAYTYISFYSIES